MTHDERVLTLQLQGWEPFGANGIRHALYGQLRYLTWASVNGPKIEHSSSTTRSINYTWDDIPPVALHALAKYADEL